MFKDLFSNHASDYKRFRPTYPEALFSFLSKQVTVHEAAWDCGTGNGQGAIGLAPYFKQVYATDASKAQIDQTAVAENITYAVATAEQSNLPDQSVSVVTVFQALHWFNLDKFYREVKRVLLPNGILAVMGYNTAITGIAGVDAVYREFCFDYLWEKDCWAMERGSLNSNYKEIDFPFQVVATPSFKIEMQWCYQDYLAYLNTWSAVKIHIQKYDENPVEHYVAPKIASLWPDKTMSRTVHFPLILKVGRV